MVFASLCDSYRMVIGSLLHGLVDGCLLAGYVLVVGCLLAAHGLVIGRSLAAYRLVIGRGLAAYGLVSSVIGSLRAGYWDGS